MDIFLNGLRNWKTTLLGFLGMLTVLITQADALVSGTSADRIKIVTESIGVFLMGLLPKDADKTGIVKQDVVSK